MQSYRLPSLAHSDKNLGYFAGKSEGEVTTPSSALPEHPISALIQTNQREESTMCGSLGAVVCLLAVVIIVLVAMLWRKRKQRGKNLIFVCWSRNLCSL